MNRKSLLWVLATVAWMSLQVMATSGNAANTSGTTTMTYAATIRISGSNTQTVDVQARDYWDAKNRIKGIYCGGVDCIVEGPWIRH